MRLARFAAGLVVLVVCLGAGFFLWARQPQIDAVTAPSSFERALIERGAQLAAAGNCTSCHTAEGGKPLAGGRPLPTPFGTIYGSNITPDRDSGIGGWSEAAFARAMREGVDRTGNHLYPAFPYDHFTLLDDADVHALYAYVMSRTPVSARTPPNELTFPFNLRPLLAGWKLLYFKPGRFTPDPARSEEENRGAYLVEGLAHCGACHTERNALGAVQRDRALAGGSFGDWIAPAINAQSPAPVPWTADALFAYLRTGHAPHHGAAVGPMQEVAYNLAQASEQDVRAIATQVEAIMGPPGAARQQRAKDLIARAGARMPTASQGVRAQETSGSASGGGASAASELYAGACAICHDAGRTGFSDGIDLSLVTSLRLSSPQNFLNVVLHGITPRDTETGAMMPGFAQALTDSQLAELAGYVRAKFAALPPWDDVEKAAARARRSQGGAS